MEGTEEPKGKAEIRDVVRAAWALCDGTEDLGVEVNEHLGYHVDPEEWEALAAAVTRLDAIIPDHPIIVQDVRHAVDLFWPDTNYFDRRIAEVKANQPDWEKLWAEQASQVDWLQEQLERNDGWSREQLHQFYAGCVLSFCIGGLLTVFFMMFVYSYFYGHCIDYVNVACH